MVNGVSRGIGVLLCLNILFLYVINEQEPI
jgi:hypothetical protein